MTPEIGIYFDRAQTLLDAACAALEVSEFDCPPRHCVLPGAEVAWEDCCKEGGQLGVNVVRWFGARDFPSLSVAGGGPVGPSSASNNCVLPFTVVEYFISIVRCSPVGTGQHPPKCEALSEAARMMITDAETIRHAIDCYLQTLPKLNPWQLGDTASFGPEGGCAGSSLTLWIGFNNCRPCT